MKLGREKLSGEKLSGEKLSEMNLSGMKPGPGGRNLSGVKLDEG